MVNRGRGWLHSLAIFRNESRLREDESLQNGEGKAPGSGHGRDGMGGRGTCAEKYAEGIGSRNCGPPKL